MSLFDTWRHRLGGVQVAEQNDRTPHHARRVTYMRTPTVPPQVRSSNFEHDARWQVRYTLRPWYVKYLRFVGYTHPPTFRNAPIVGPSIQTMRRGMRPRPRWQGVLPFPKANIHPSDLTKQRWVR